MWHAGESMARDRWGNTVAGKKRRGNSGGETQWRVRLACRHLSAHILKVARVLSGAGPFEEHAAEEDEECGPSRQPRVHPLVAVGEEAREAETEGDDS